MKIKLNHPDLFPSDHSNAVRDPEKVLVDVMALISMYKSGLLGGKTMPEDANPGLDTSSKQSYLYYTLPMALNYQRDSYSLWRSALATFKDQETAFVFEPDLVSRSDLSTVQSALLKHKLALQKNKHTQTWIRISCTLSAHFKSDVKHLLSCANWSVAMIKDLLQKEHKKGFPYLSGEKICNYWLYVLEQYTDTKFTDRFNISIAPDTHVLQSTKRLGLLIDSIDDKNTRLSVSAAWRNLLHGTQLSPIDVHTPLWLWSRAGFPAIRNQLFRPPPELDSH